MSKKSRAATRPERQTPTGSSPETLAARPNPTRAERLAGRRETRSRGRQAAAQSRRRQRRIQQIIIAVAAVLILGAGSVYAYQRITYVEPGETAEGQGGGHVGTEVTVTDYNTDPPTSGQHWGSVANWGVHSEPVPNELQVHNLEHGGVIIQYNDTVTPEEISELEEIVNQCDVKLILAPRPEMEQRIAVTAWTKYLNLEEVDREAIQDFIDAHVDNGPERIASETERWNDCN